MNHATRHGPLLALALACAPGVPGSATDSGSTTGTSTLSTSGTSTPPSSGPTTDVTTTTGGPTDLDGASTCNFGPSIDMGFRSCSLYLQDCPEGQKCAPASTDGGSAWTDHICVPLDPNPAPPGAPCTTEGVSGVDTCARGSMCWDLDWDTGVGTCVSHCISVGPAPTCRNPSDTDVTCADSTELCILGQDQILTFCVPKCDPLDLADCPDELCLPNPQGEAGFACVLDASGGAGFVDAPCAFESACNPGLICVDVTHGKNCDQGAPGCCQPYCDLTQPPESYCNVNADQVCLPLFDIGQAPPGYSKVGVCGIPQ